MIDGPGDPVLRVNNVYILPLKTDGTGWSVVEKRDTVTILPGVALSAGTAPPATPKAFLLREVANVLVSGSIEDMFDIAEFLKFQPSRGLMGEVMAELHGSLTPDSARFLEVAAECAVQPCRPRELASATGVRRHADRIASIP